MGVVGAGWEEVEGSWRQWVGEGRREVKVGREGLGGEAEATEVGVGEVGGWEVVEGTQWCSGLWS
jgi:hypothetical protein